MATSDSPLSVPDVTLAVARGAVAPGDISGITVTALDGSIAHGNRVRIEAEASYGIGPKDEAAPKWWQMGQDIRVGGSVITAEPIGDGPDLTNLWTGEGGVVTVSANNKRHSFVDRAYLSMGRGNLTDPAWPATPAEVGRRYYQSMWIWCGQNHFGSMMFKVSNLSGTFNLNADRTPAEDVELVSGDGQRTIVGQITHYYAPTREVTVYFDAWGATADFFGGTITGLTSGATADIDSDPYGLGRFISSSSTKFGRPGTANREPGVYYTYGANGGGQLFNSARDASGALINTENQGSADIDGSPDLTPRQWVQLEWVVDLSSNNDLGGKMYFYSGGSLIYENEISDTTTIRANGTAIDIRNIGMETSVGNSDNYGVSQYWGEIYADNDSRRLYLCDASTVAASTAKELLRPDAWTENPDGSVVIDAYLYQGAFSDLTGKFLALVDGKTPIFEGVAI